MKIKVGVIFGGESVEHEVSIISAIQAMNKMDEEKYEIIPIYITKDREWYTGDMLKDIDVYQDFNLIKKYSDNVVLYYKDGSYILQKKKGLLKSNVKEIDIAFPIVHGTNVEDGALQGYLKTIGIPFVGPDVYAAVAGQDKVVMKDIWKEAGLPMTNYVWFYDTEYKENLEEIKKKIKKLKFPVIVKPATTGSSIGITICENDEKVSEIEEVLSKNKFLTYSDKYIGSGKGKLKGIKSNSLKTSSKGMATANRKLPAELENNTKEEIEDIATKAFKAIGTSGNARIDFLIDQKTNKVYINEINSIPGSLAFYLWDAKHINFTQVLDDMINIGIKDYKKRMSKKHSFESNILQGFAVNRGLKGGKGKLKY